MTVQYLPWAISGSANVYTYAVYSARGEVLTGVVPGQADPTLFNTTLRQATMGTAVLANFINQTTNVNMLDDGNVQNFVTYFKSALATILVTSVPPLYSGSDTSSTANNIVATVTPALTGPVNGGIYMIRNNNTNTGPAQITLNGGQTYPCVKGQNAPLAGYECFAGDWTAWTFTGSAYQLLNDKTVSTSVIMNVSNVTQLMQAVVAASQMTIASNVYVTIQLAAGTYALTSITGPIYFAHACGQRIKIVGAPLKASFPTKAQIVTAATNAGALALYQTIWQTVITTVGVNGLELHTGAINSVQNVLFVGDQTASGGHYGALIGNWSLEPGFGSVQMINCMFHGFGLDNCRAEQLSTIQANNVGSTYSTAHAFHVSHGSGLEVNVGGILAMYGTQGVALQNEGLFAVDSASGTCDISYNSVAGIAGLGDATVNLNPATGIRIQNNTQYGINCGFLCNIALSSNGSTTFSGNGQDINISNASNCLTFGCSLPSGSSPSRGSTGNNGAAVY